MSRVLTFSRTFPSYHPKKGEPTFFVEKIWNNILKNKNTSYYEMCSLNENMEENRKAIIWDFWVMLKKAHEVPEIKSHTIRAGHRWKVGDKISPRVWSGKPYQSKQIIIAPDIEVKKVWDIWHDENGWWINGNSFYAIERLAQNDGLSLSDFLAWFNVHPKKKGQTFNGEIICWNENINY